MTKLEGGTNPKNIAQYLQKQLKLNVSEQKLKNLEIDSKQPDFEK